MKHRTGDHRSSLNDIAFQRSPVNVARVSLGSLASLASIASRISCKEGICGRDPEALSGNGMGKGGKSPGGNEGRNCGRFDDERRVSLSSAVRSAFKELEEAEGGNIGAPSSAKLSGVGVDSSERGWGFEDEGSYVGGATGPMI